MENINTQENWNNYHNAGIFLNYPDKFKFISRDLLNMAPGSKILELGCGPGLLLQQIKIDHPTFILKGIDFSEAAIKNINNIDVSVEVVPKCLKKYKSEWNAVIGTEFLEHLEENDRIETIKEVYRILVRGGKAIFTVPDNVLSPTESRFHLVCYNQRSFKNFLNLVFYICGVFSKEFLVSDIPHPNPKKYCWGKCPFLFGVCYKR